MGRTFAAIDDSVRDFIARQRMFFVATAPLAADGLLNLSPKGLDTFRILDQHTVAYADLTGSGIETVAHLRENGRVVIMFCAFDGPPKIVRLHGRGEVLEPSHAEFAILSAEFPTVSGLRSVIRVHCDRVSESCGFSVPRYDFVEQRSQLTDWSSSKSAAELQAYHQRRNSHSIDGLPGLTDASAEPASGG